MKHGAFVVIEGCDGSGKTTVCQAVYQQLLEEGADVVYTREPGGIDIAEQIRRVILDPKNTAMDNRTEALLYAASRRQHVAEKILPALAKGKLVLCERFVYSSLAYQGYARGIGIEAVWDINRFAIEDCMPDGTIFLNIDAKTGLERIQGRRFLDRLDQENLSFHQKVYEGYQEVLKRYGQQTIMVDASRALELVIQDVYQIVKKEFLK